MVQDLIAAETAGVHRPSYIKHHGEHYTTCFRGISRTIRGILYQTKPFYEVLKTVGLNHTSNTWNECIETTHTNVRAYNPLICEFLKLFEPFGTRVCEPTLTTKLI